MVRVIKQVMARWLVLLIVGGLVSGCATRSKALWNSRVGSFTYDQAVLDMGPPDKTAKLADGTVVAEWLTLRGHYGRIVGPMYSYPYGGGVWIEPSSPDVFIRLTFGSDSRLKQWRKVYR